MFGQKIRLFCFPYAGGSSFVYSGWQDLLDDRVILEPVELAGRGRRITESFYNSMDEAAEDVLQKIRFHLADRPYAFFGHSMGGAIAYRLAQRIRELRYPQPLHVFFSGRGCPHIFRQDKPPYHTLPEDQFKEKILELGGTPPEFFEHPELADVLLPLLRSDFKISWHFTRDFGEIKPLDCDITVLVGKTDDLKPEQVEGWKLHTSQKCQLHHFEGGHFFINHKEQKKEMLDIVNSTLLKLVK